MADQHTHVVKMYHLHHLRIQVAGTDVDVLEQVHAVLLYKGARPASRLDRADIVLTIQRGQESWILPPAARRIAAHEHGIEVFQDDSLYYLRTATGGAVIDPGAQTARCTLLTAAAAASTFYLVILTLVILMRKRGLFTLHAAGLVYDGSGILLVARSGSGKTTAAFNLVRQGWGFLSDDAVLIQENDASIEALSFRRDFCIRPEAASYFPELSREAWPVSLSDASKWCVDVRGLYGAPSIASAVPRLLLLPQITDLPNSTLEPVVKRDALAHLIEHSALFLTPETETAREHLLLLSRLLTQAPAYRLLSGRDVLEVPKRLADLISSAL